MKKLIKKIKIWRASKNNTTLAQRKSNKFLDSFNSQLRILSNEKSKEVEYLLNIELIKLKTSLDDSINSNLKIKNDSNISETVKIAIQNFKSKELPSVDFETKLNSIHEFINDPSNDLTQEEIKSYKLKIIDDIKNRENRSWKNHFNNSILDFNTLYLIIRELKNKNSDYVNEFIEVINKCLDVFYENTGIEVILPNEGEYFNQEIHKIISKDNNANDKQIIKSVSKEGYLYKGSLIEPADVIIG